MAANARLPLFEEPLRTGQAACRADEARRIAANIAKAAGTAAQGQGRDKIAQMEAI